MTVDRELVTRKMALIARDLAALRPFAQQDVRTYLERSIDQAVVERYLERIIGRMIDINYHLITEAGDAPPADYYTSFSRLAELKVLDGDFALRIARAAGLRNRLVHEYNEFEPAKVFQALGAALEDIPVYLRKINEHLARLSRETGGQAE